MNLRSGRNLRANKANILFGNVSGKEAVGERIYTPVKRLFAGRSGAYRKIERGAYVREGNDISKGRASLVSTPTQQKRAECRASGRITLNRGPSSVTSRRCILFTFFSVRRRRVTYRRRIITPQRLPRPPLPLHPRSRAPLAKRT